MLEYVVCGTCIGDERDANDSIGCVGSVGSVV